MQPQQPKKPTDNEIAASIVRLAADWESIPDTNIRAIVKAVMTKAGMPVQEGRAEPVMVMISGEEGKKSDSKAHTHGTP